MAVSQKTCTRCGAFSPLTAPVCVKCGTPFAPVAQTPQSVAMAAPPPLAYTPYPVAPGAASRLPRLSESRLLLVAGGILLLGCLVVVLVVYLLTPSAVPPCRFDCGPAIGSRLPGAATYHSQQFGFEVDYPSSWSLLQGGGDGVRLGTDAGEMLVRGEKAGKSADQLTQEAIASLPTSSWQGISAMHVILGSHIGFQDGAGTEFSANFYPSEGQKVEMRIVVITATEGGVSVVFLAWNPYAQPKGGRDRSGIPEAQRFDYVLNEFRWSGA